MREIIPANKSVRATSGVASVLFLSQWSGASAPWRLALLGMKVLLAFCFLLVGTSLFATPPEYHSSRAWVEQRCGTNATPKDERIFVGRIVPYKYAGVIHFHKGINLREIIDQTPFKGTAVMVCVLRAERRAPGHVFRVASSEKPKYEVKSLDMIWLYEDGPVIW